MTQTNAPAVPLPASPTRRVGARYEHINLKPQHKWRAPTLPSSPARHPSRKANAADITALHQPRKRKVPGGGNVFNDLDFINDAFINRFNLAGWKTDMGERVHDSFIPEFGHELLRGFP